ncbi:hypothetical protein V6N12_074153 [Hibiscus sabdariffa]|uniref:indole-3-pyruvate monooxygenase n=1 Tax=Hibiscus sabdariffa TaxID=183260 RepID=A0ABR2BG04_9ROSI
MHSFFVAEKRTYDRFKLHLPKQFCLLPKLPFLEDFPEYPITEQVMEYLGSYARRLDDTSRSCRREFRELTGLVRKMKLKPVVVNGEKLDSVVLATGYRSNVPSWLQVRERMSDY